MLASGELRHRTLKPGPLIVPVHLAEKTGRVNDVRLFRIERKARALAAADRLPAAAHPAERVAADIAARNHHRASVLLPAVEVVGKEAV